MNTDTIKRLLTALSSVAKVERGQLYQLVGAAEASYHLRDIQSQREIGLALQTFPYPFSQVGKYYESIYLFRTGQHQRANQLFESVAESAPAQYRSRALLSISGLQEYMGHFEEALRLRLQVLSSGDPVSVMDAQWSIAVLQSMAGEHRAALRDLERFLPFAHTIGKSGHPAFIKFLNSYAIELAESGRSTEAEQVANVIAASPLISRYPEWQETVSEVRTKRKRSSIVSVTSRQESKPRDSRIQRVIDFMNANLTRKLDLKELAAVARISKSHFSRVFKREIGLSPVDYLIRLRMEKVRELLNDRALNVQEIMTLTGFNARSNFLHHFHQYFKHAPSEYRKLIR